MTEKHAFLAIDVTWVSVQPDRRNYKPGNPLLSVNLPVRVDVPLTAEYIANSEKIIQSQLGFDTGTLPVPDSSPILTPRGMRYIVDELEAVMMDKPKPDLDTDDLDTDDFEPDLDADEFAGAQESSIALASDDEFDDVTEVLPVEEAEDFEFDDPDGDEFVEKPPFVDTEEDEFDFGSDN